MKHIVKFKAAYGSFNKGEVAGFEPEQAAKLVAAEVAERIGEADPTARAVEKLTNDADGDAVRAAVEEAAAEVKAELDQRAADLDARADDLDAREKDLVGREAALSAAVEPQPEPKAEAKADGKKVDGKPPVQGKGK